MSESKIDCRMCGGPSDPETPARGGEPYQYRGERIAGEELVLCPDCRESFLADGERDAFLEEAFWLELRLKRQPLPPEGSLA